MSASSSHIISILSHLNYLSALILTLCLSSFSSFLIAVLVVDDDDDDGDEEKEGEEEDHDDDDVFIVTLRLPRMSHLLCRLLCVLIVEGKI